MKIEVNGKIEEFSDSSNLKAIINQTLSDTNGIAAALNNSVVPKAQWEETQLKQNDKILLIKATQGG